MQKSALTYLAVVLLGVVGMRLGSGMSEGARWHDEAPMGVSKERLDPNVDSPDKALFSDTLGPRIMCRWWKATV